LLPPRSACKQPLARSRWRSTATTSENETLKDETLEKQVLKSNPPLPPAQAGFFFGRNFAKWRNFSKKILAKDECF
jgi:hypothetical protein